MEDHPLDRQRRRRPADIRSFPRVEMVASAGAACREVSRARRPSSRRRRDSARNNTAIVIGPTREKRSTIPRRDPWADLPEGAEPPALQSVDRQNPMRHFCTSAFVVILAVHFWAEPILAQQSSRPTERTPAPIRPTQSGMEVFRTYSPAVAVIEATDDASRVMRFGSGVLLTQRQVLVTNAHVVIGPGHIRARFGSDLYSPPDVEVQYVDTDADLAVLKLTKVPQRSPAIRLRVGTLPDVGQRVFAIGNPQGLERTFSEGVISAVRSLAEIGVVVQHTAPISPGSSGGALFDDKGELIGLTVAYLKDGQNLNFAIPATAVASAVEQAFDVPNEAQSLAAFAARTRKRFPGVYDGLEDESLISRFRNRYPALGTGGYDEARHRTTEAGDHLGRDARPRLSGAHNSSTQNPARGET